MTQEHKDVLLARCSKDKNVPMPVFNEKTPAKGTRPDTTSTTTLASNAASCIVTPVPLVHSTSLFQHNAVPGTKSITPSPALAAAAKKATTQKQPTKAEIEMMSKWKAAAKKRGGADIVLQRTAAKKLIYDLLYDAFCPMNITQIYEVCDILCSFEIAL